MPVKCLNDCTDCQFDVPTDALCLKSIQRTRAWIYRVPKKQGQCSEFKADFKEEMKSLINDTKELKLPTKGFVFKELTGALADLIYCISMSIRPFASDREWSKDELQAWDKALALVKKYKIKVNRPEIVGVITRPRRVIR